MLRRPHAISHQWNQHQLMLLKKQSLPRPTDLKPQQIGHIKPHILYITKYKDDEYIQMFNINTPAPKSPITTNRVGAILLNEVVTDLYQTHSG